MVADARVTYLCPRAHIAERDFWHLFAAETETSSFTARAFRWKSRQMDLLVRIMIARPMMLTVRFGVKV